MTRKQLVNNSIEQKGIDRIPIYLFNRDEKLSDIAGCGVCPSEHFHPADPNTTEWGFTWERIDDTMGQPKFALLDDWAKLQDYQAPDPTDISRFRYFDDRISHIKDQFVLSGMGVSGFGIMTFLRGFENTLEDLYCDRESIVKLADIVFGYEEEIMKQVVKYDGIDGYTFYDDWGMQNTLMINPTLWREFFKPRYKRQFDILKKAGKKIFFHSCGYVFDIIEDLLEIGADILNFNQPDVMGIDKLSQFRGRVCFNCPVDLQTVAIRADKQQIYDYTNHMIEQLSTDQGGFIGYVEEYHSIGLSERNYQYMWDALREYQVK